MTPHDAFTRRKFLERAGVAGAAVAGGTLWATAPAAARARRFRPRGPIRHLVVSCQENRSFDHYFGYAPQVQARRLGPPRGYTQPDDAGVGHAPFELTAMRSVDPPHGWEDVHAQYNGGKMDGFYRNAALRTGDGNNAIPYYTAKELPFYYSLFRNSGLCANYFCSLLGPTWPNRFYLMSGTSGGITTNGLWGYGIFDSRQWPIILDLLDEAEVSWKIYYIGFDGVEVGDTDNVAVFWSRWAHDPRTTATLDDYLEDCRRGTLPNVSWIIPSYSMQFDEHPDADVSIGMGFQEQVINALRQSPLWRRSALFLTYDEHGGFFDHVPPPQVDAYGLGMRVPFWVVSPYARRGPTLSRKRADHVSTLKFIERAFGLPTLASRNHTFDRSTPTGHNYEAGGAPARPRDGMPGLSDLFDLFDFDDDEDR
jgi:phospholipase C